MKLGVTDITIVHNIYIPGQKYKITLKNEEKDIIYNI